MAARLLEREAAGHFGDYDITIQLIPTQPGLSSQVCVVGVQQQLRPAALLQLHPLAGTLARVRVSVLNINNVTNPTLHWPLQTCKRCSAPIHTQKKVNVGTSN